MLWETENRVWKRGTGVLQESRGVVEGHMLRADCVSALPRNQHVRRVYDAEHQTLLYISYSSRLTQAGPLPSQVPSQVLAVRTLLDTTRVPPVQQSAHAATVVTSRGRD